MNLDPQNIPCVDYKMKFKKTPKTKKLISMHLDKSIFKIAKFPENDFHAEKQQRSNKNISSTEK